MDWRQKKYYLCAVTLELHTPQDGFYKGTRFDRGGVFKSLVFGGVEMCGQWFESYSPTMHDAVLGPAEEFSPMPVTPGPFPVIHSSSPVTVNPSSVTQNPSSVTLSPTPITRNPSTVIPSRPEGAAEESHTLLKPGVGLIDIGPEPYDRFKLYRIVDPGRWEVDGMRFRHILEGYYDYTKEIVVTGENSFEIRHCYKAFSAYEGDVYNHNFFTFGKLEIWPSRQIDFPFRPEGTWRAEYDSVGFTESGIRFSRQLQKGESVYTGNIHEAGKEGMPYAMSISEGPLRVSIQGDVPVFKTVLWANHRIACLEPYNRISALPGQAFCWNIRYTLYK